MMEDTDFFANVNNGSGDSSPIDDGDDSPPSIIENSSSSNENIPSHRLKTAEKLANIYKDHNKVQHLKAFELKHDVRTMCVVGEDVWIASRDGSIHIRDMQLGNKVGIWRAHRPDSRVTTKFYANSIFADSDLKKIWVGASDGIVRCLSCSRSPKMLHELTDQHKGGIKSVVGNKDYVWTASEDFTIFQRSADNGVPVNKLMGHSSWVRSMVFHSGTKTLWSASVDGIRVWSLDLDAKPMSPLPTSNGTRRRPHTSRPSISRRESCSSVTSVATVTREGFVNSNCIARLEGHDGCVMCLLVVGNNIWSGGTDGCICVWNCETHSLVIKFKAHASWVHVLHLVGAADSQTVWSACRSEIGVWDCDGNRVQTLKIAKGKVADIAYSHGRVWVGCRSPGSLQIYRLFSTSAGSRSGWNAIRSRLKARRRGTWDAPSRQESSGDTTVDTSRQDRMDFLKRLKDRRASRRTLKRGDRKSDEDVNHQGNDKQPTVKVSTSGSAREYGHHSHLPRPGFMSSRTKTPPRSQIPVAQAAHDEVEEMEWSFSETPNTPLSANPVDASPRRPPKEHDVKRIMKCDPSNLSREELLLFVRELRLLVKSARDDANNEQLAKLVLAAKLDEQCSAVERLERELEQSRQLEFEATEKLLNNEK